MRGSVGRTWLWIARHGREAGKSRTGRAGVLAGSELDEPDCGCVGSSRHILVRLLAMPIVSARFSSQPPSHPMPAPSGHLSQEGYVSSSPSTDAHLMDPYAAHQRRFYDTESDNAEYGRRDTYASDSSNAHMMEPSFDDRNPNYDFYRKYSPS